MEFHMSDFSAKRRHFLFLSISALFTYLWWGLKFPFSEKENDKALTRIAFGSCAQQSDPQPIWNVIAQAKPDLFLFIGDNIYADTEDMKEMAAKYQTLASKPEYAGFRARVPILATWDDHDFGINDGGREYPRKEESKQMMLEFFGEPQDSPRRKRPGVYTSYKFGPKGQQLQIILLDLRWFRSPLIYDQKLGSYVPNPDPKAVMLGADQWDWLEEELKKPADLRIIASSTQFVSPDHKWEKWANFPLEKQRMLDLLDKLDIRNAFVISGDMHYGELSAERTPKGFMLYDLSSSGLNISEPGADLPNRYRLAIHDTSANFGFIEIDWGAEIAVSLQVRDINGKTVIRKDIRF